MASMVNWSWLPPIFAQASERVSGSLGELAGGATVWLAVTGLSRSGKTVFVTSLIHNLLSCAHNPNRMPLLGVVGERRLIAATLEAAKANRLPRFPYLDNIDKMAIPDWPARTEGISEIGIEVRFAPAGRARLRRVVARDTAAIAQGRACRDRARVSRSSRPAPARRRCERGGRKTFSLSLYRLPPRLPPPPSRRFSA